MDKNIKVTNNSNYEISFFVIYHLNGKRIMNNPESSFKQNISRIIKIPSEATNIKINIRYMSHLNSKEWFAFFHKSLLKAEDKCFVVENTCFVLPGTKRIPKCSEVDC